MAFSEPDAKPLRPVASLVLVAGLCAGLVWLAMSLGEAAWVAFSSTSATSERLAW